MVLDSILDYISLFSVILGLVVCIYWLVRNDFVSELRREILNDNIFNDGKLTPYKELPSYSSMVWDLFNWSKDLEDWIKEE